MADIPSGPSDLDQLLKLLDQFQELVQQHATTQRQLQLEHERLQRAVAETVTRLMAMVSGSRASRTELQAIIDALRMAQGGAAAEPST